GAENRAIVVLLQRAPAAVLRHSVRERIRASIAADLELERRGRRQHRRSERFHALTVPLLEEDLDLRTDATRAEEVPVSLILKCREARSSARLRWQTQRRARIENQVLLTMSEKRRLRDGVERCDLRQNGERTWNALQIDRTAAAQLQPALIEHTRVELIAPG